MITSEIRYLTIDMVKGAIRNLLEENILHKECFKDDKFDHTNWYTFIEYGEMYSFQREGLMDQLEWQGGGWER